MLVICFKFLCISHLNAANRLLVARLRNVSHIKRNDRYLMKLYMYSYIYKCHCDLQQYLRYIYRTSCWQRVIFIKMDTVPPCATMLWVFLFGVLHVHGYRGHFMTKEFSASVLHNLSLKCHTIDSRSSVELATLCGNHDSCMGMKTNRDLGIPGMLSSCPNATTWPGVTNMSIAPMTHLRTRKEVTWPGKWWWGQGLS